jgi:hypothetical protein
MVIARFESVPMARSAAHALVADGFSEEVVSVFYGKRPTKDRTLWERVVHAIWPWRGRASHETLLVVQLSAEHVQAAINLLRDAGSVSVEQSQDDWQTGPSRDRAEVRRRGPVRRQRPAITVSHGPGSHRTQWQP